MAWFKRLIVPVLFLLLIAFIVILVLYVKKRRMERSLPAPSDISVEVLNGCGVPKLASKMRVLLVDKGFKVVGIDDASQIYDRTVVIEHLDKDMRNAKVVARSIGCNNIMLKIDSLLFCHVTVILGKDYDRYIPKDIKVFQ